MSTPLPAKTNRPKRRRPNPLTSVRCWDGRTLYLGQQVRPFKRTDRSPASRGMITRCISAGLVEVFWVGDEFPRIEDVEFIQTEEIGGER